MNIIKMLAELRAEKIAIDEAVIILERLAQGQGGRRRRSAPAGRKRKPFSVETRKRMALAQKKRWAAARKKQKAGAPKATES